MSLLRDVSQSTRTFVEIARKDPCGYCGQPQSGTIDHIIPKSKGGRRSSWENMAGACFQCNLTKGAQGLLQFLLSHPLA
jgi:5-methylcytosine-specific restriction endonuclease McrA